MIVTAESLDVDWRQLAALEGLVSEQLGRVLAVAAAQVPDDQAIVELGSYRGKSTCYLAAGARAGAGAQVYAFDAWDLPGNEPGRHRYDTARATFDRQIEACGLTGWVVAEQSFSVRAGQAWGGRAPVGLLYVDADHGYRSVWEDFWTWWSHLAPGAVVAFDDYDTPRNPGVKQAVDRIQHGGHFARFEVLAGHLYVARLHEDKR